MSSFPVLRTRLSVCFLSSFPVSLPQLFHWCFPFAFAFGLSPSLSAFFRPLSVPVLTTQPLFLPFLSLPVFPLTVGHLSVLPFRSRFFGFPLSLQPDLSCFPSRFFVLGFLFVSFRPSLIRSHSCSSSASLLLSLSGFYLSFCFLSSASVPVLATQLSVSSFPLLPCFASQLLFRCCLSVFRLPCSSPFFLT